jgi:dTDP-4-amino-4,6-dideoxy-D-galactose acyltransferase
VSDEALVRPLAWDSDFFGFPVATLRTVPASENAWQGIRVECAERRIRCLYVPAKDLLEARIAARERALFVDTRVTLDLDLTVAAGALARTVAASANGTTLRDHRPGDASSLAAVARSAHQDTRFFQDSGFPRERAEAMYEVWLRKSCDGFADQVFIAEVEGEPAGYLACSADATTGVATLALLGVRAEQRERGLGRKLVEACIDWSRARGCKRVEVATQGHNIGAQRLYQKLGFRTLRLQHWFHLWF